MQTGSAEGEIVADRYRLSSRLGIGGMATVWRADDELLERPVAIKEVRVPAGLPAPEVERLRQRYLREARAAARLRHENVVVVHDVIPETSRVWIVMELFDAPDLAALVRDQGPLAPDVAARIGLQVLAALTAAHEAGVLHRDVKPANVLVCENGRAVLTDFGVATVTGDVSLTATGQLVGSPAYLAPERLTGGTVGAASDLWSLGCTLYAAVEGKSPFQRDEPFAILSAITVEALPPPRSAGPLAPVLLGLLEKDQADRWDAERTRAALVRVAAGQQVEAEPGWGAPADAEASERPADPASEVTVRSGTDPPAPAPAARRPRRRRLVTAVLLLVALLGMVGAATEFFFHPLGLDVGVLRAQADSQDLGGARASPEPSQIVVNHPDGFTVVVPYDWAQTAQTGSLYRFTRPAPQSGSDAASMNLFLEAKPAGGRNSYELARSYDAKLAADRAGFPTYRLIELRRATFGAYRGAVHEFSYINPNSGPRHVIVFRTVSSDISYEISLNGPADQFEESRAAFSAAVASLQIRE